MFQYVLTIKHNDRFDRSSSRCCKSHRREQRFFFLNVICKNRIEYYIRQSLSIETIRENDSRISCFEDLNEKKII